MTPPRARSAPIWAGDAAIGIAALAVRALYLFELARTPLFSMRIGDADAYLAWAERIAAGNWLGSGEGVFYQAPLYPYFLASIFAVAGPGSLLAVRLVQIVLGAAACVLLARAGRAWFPGTAGDRVGALAGWLLALYPASIFFDGLIQKSVLDSFFLCAILLLVARLAAAPLSRARATLLGAALGGLMLTRENAIVVVALVAVWLVVPFRRETGRARAASAALVAAGLALVVLPVAFRNLAVGGEFHLSTSQLGPNFYMGNNPKADGFYMALRPGRGHAKFERQDATELAEAALGRHLSPGEVSSYWLGEAWRFVRSEPGAWSGLQIKKALLLVNDVEVSDSEDQYSYADRSHVLRWLGALWRFGTLVALGAFGMVLTWPERRRIWFLHALVLAYAASVVAFYVFARYRFPLVPPLVLFAAAGLVRGWDLYRERRFRPLALAGGVALAVAVAAQLHLLLPGRLGIDRDRMRAVTLVNMGVDLLERQNDTAAAAPFFERALQLQPRYAKAHLGLATVRTRAADLDGALRECEAALRDGADIDEVRYEYGLALYRLGRRAEAMEQFRAAIALNANYSYAYNALGLCLVGEQKTEEALESYGKAVQADPKNAEAFYNWGNALAKLGRYGEAVDRFRAAVAAKPDYRNARLNLGTALSYAGRTTEAIAELREALRRWPDDREAARRLADAEARGTQGSP